MNEEQIKNATECYSITMLINLLNFNNTLICQLVYWSIWKWNINDYIWCEINKKAHETNTVNHLLSERYAFKNDFVIDF